jgi:hypothetical protein
MTVLEIAKQLNEPNTELIGKIVNAIGIERVNEYLQKTLTIEAESGMMTRDGERRRTPGGVFFYVVKDNLSKAEQKQIFPKMPGTQPKKKVIQAVSWEDAQKIAVAINQTPGKGATVKLTLVGRPKKVAKAGEGAVVVSLQGKPPGALPKGLPVPPETGITWAVFIVNKQWNKVKDSMSQNANDSLIVEGYPLVDKNGVGIVLATNVKSKLMEQAARETQN